MDKAAILAELEAATIELRDTGLHLKAEHARLAAMLKASQERYQAALQAFNRAVAPDPDAK